MTNGKETETEINDLKPVITELGEKVADLYEQLRAVEATGDSAAQLEAEISSIEAELKTHKRRYRELKTDLQSQIKAEDPAAHYPEETPGPVARFVELGILNGWWGTHNEFYDIYRPALQAYSGDDPEEMRAYGLAQVDRYRETNGFDELTRKNIELMTEVPA